MEGKGLDIIHTAYGPVRRCPKHCYELYNFNNVRIPRNYITYVILNTNLLHNIFTY